MKKPIQSVSKWVNESVNSLRSLRSLWLNNAQRPVTEAKRSQNPKRPLLHPCRRAATIFLIMLHNASHCRSMVFYCRKSIDIYVQVWFTLRVCEPKRSQRQVPEGTTCGVADIGRLATYWPLKRRTETHQFPSVSAANRESGNTQVFPATQDV